MKVVLSGKGFVDHPVQSIMSRTGSFPLRVAHRLLKQFGDPSDIVLDPFCGKGTTLLAARILGFSAYGMDIAPEAVLCTRSKLVNVTLSDVCKYINDLRVGSSSDRSPMFAKVFFHPSTLKQILSIRNKLLLDILSGDKNQQQNAVFVLSSLLGILHGHASFSLSIPSAHAYSMSPTYVAKYAKRHNLTAPFRDVKSCLIQKVSRCLAVKLPRKGAFDVRKGSVLNCSEIFPELVGKTNLVFTSPPYLNAQTYAKDNWLRLWLLGYNHKDLRPDYIETGSVHRYQDMMSAAFKEISRMLAPGGRLICIAGDVRLPGHNGINTGEIFRTGTFLARLCESKEIGLHVQKYEVHEVPSNYRYFHALSSSNGHAKRKLIERIFIAQKPLTTISKIKSCLR